jgi:hypothetical protein
MDYLLIVLEIDNVALGFLRDSQNDSSCGPLLEASTLRVTIHHPRGAKGYNVE